MQKLDYRPPQVPLDILHHDHELLLVNKPAGLLSVPGKGDHLSDCLIVPRAGGLSRGAAGAPARHGHVGGDGLWPHAPCAAPSRAAIRETTSEKNYVARVWGRVADKTGEVDLPLIVDWPNRPLQMVDHEAGKPAQTAWRVMRHGEAETRVRLYPRTGRSHQLRVHMREIGHPSSAIRSTRPAPRAIFRA